MRRTIALALSAIIVMMRLSHARADDLPPLAAS